MRHAAGSQYLATRVALSPPSLYGFVGRFALSVPSRRIGASSVKQNSSFKPSSAMENFRDPRPYYFISGDQKLVFLDEMFIPGVKKDPKFIEGEIKAKPSGSAPAKKPEEPGEVKSKIQTIELNVKLCCGNCVRNVKKALDDVEGVEKVDCEQDLNKVYVKCSTKPETILKKVQKVDKRATLAQKKTQKN
ncbi:uncharacterized protein [Physcomitrium patens]|uniref:HMA domain-containing protein n=1 Tax=Physcomitrium patens TaxID=3218 RepID=A0A2K1JG06_PHYPA|nr:uncharacterized protein LOC112291426 [Physcomitrium patens]PNR40472.1 hypothetical protein PHYPA_017874 [Physcomitrium patens]|eukprot:XP_024394556.1 uncharacterized protein LOC112291426 [Physcomitrella patens]